MQSLLEKSSKHLPRFPPKRESLKSAILFILSIATAILTQTNLMKSPFLQLLFVVKLNLNRLSVCLRDVSKWHQIKSRNILFLLMTLAR